MRVAACVAALLLSACDGAPPSVDLLGDGGREWSLVTPRESHGSELGGATAPASPLPPPSDSWSSPAECAAATEGSYCQSCWSWADGGPASLDRNEVGDAFGSAVALGDINGDGYPDLAVGAPGEDHGGTADVGRVYVFLGSTRGFQPWVSYGPEDFEVEPVASVAMGAHLAIADFDADGFADLAIAFGGLPEGSPVAVGYGRPHGLEERLPLKLESLDPSGLTASLRFGEALATGDFDDDGVSDLAIGVPSYPTSGLANAGAVIVATGSATGLVQGYRVDLASLGTTPWADDRFGAALDSHPVLGAPDALAVGMPGYSWVFRVDYMSTPGHISTTTGLAGFGTRVAMGDLDGDNVLDIVAGGATGSHLEVAGTGTSISSFATLGSRSIWPLAIRDVDDDGDSDLLAVSLPTSVANDEYEVLFYEGNGTYSPAPFIYLDAPSGEAQDQLGVVGAVVDYDGDWLPDVVLGAPAADGTSQHGEVHLFRVDDVSEWASEPDAESTVHQEAGLDACDICSVHGWSDGTVCDGGPGAEICVAGACVMRGCGDGYRQLPTDPWGPSERESCDDGNQLNGDACSDDCSASTPLVIASEASMSDSPSRLPPSVGADGRGHVLFAYVHDDDEARSLRARTYNYGGSPDQEVNASLELAALPGVGFDPEATVAGLEAGGWVVAWTDPDVDEGASGIAFRVVAADGSLGTLRSANQDGRGEQREPRVAALDAGFLISWTDASGFDGPLGRSLIEARRFTDGGAAIEDEWTVSDPAVTSSRSAVASAGADYLLVWTETPDDEYQPSTLWARRFGAMGDAAPFVLSANGLEPSVALLETGDYVVSWTTRASDYRGDIVARVVPASGDPLASAELTVANALGSEMASSVTGYLGPDFAVAYEIGGHRRGLSWLNPDMSAMPPNHSELTLLGGLLSGHLEGDVTLLRTSRGLWFAWSDAGDVSTDAYRSFLAFLLPLD